MGKICAARVRENYGGFQIEVDLWAHPMNFYGRFHFSDLTLPQGVLF